MSSSYDDIAMARKELAFEPAPIVPVRSRKQLALIRKKWRDFFAAFRKPAHTEVRFIAATRAENEAARRKQIDRRCELAVAVALLTDEQRTRAIAAAQRGRG